MTAEPLPNNEPSALARIWADLVAAGWRESVLRYATHAVLLLVLVAAIWARGLNLGFIGWLTARATLNPVTAAGAPAASGPAATPPPQNDTVTGMVLPAAD